MSTHNKEIYPVIVIGGGPSGIAASYHLKNKGIEHIVIEKKEMLQTWKNERWDSFFLVTPNWMTNLPGIDQDLPYNNEYMTKDEIYSWLKRFMDYVNPKYSEHTDIERLYKEDGLYELKTNKGLFKAEKIIIATGMFNQPFIPPVAEALSRSVNQFHSIDYFNSGQLAQGGTVVVGSGRSGVQIALEIKTETNNNVYLSVGSMTPLPTIYRDVNGVYWLNRLSGYKAGKSILQYKYDDLENENIKHKISQNMFSCVASGVKLTGRFMLGRDNLIEFSDNLCEVLDHGAEYLKKVEAQIDNEIEKSELELPDLQVDFDLKTIDCHELDPIMFLDVEKDNIKNIIWCTGFKPDYSWIDLDIFDTFGSPSLINGCSTKEKVYFCGMGLQPDKETKSSFGVGLYAFSESAQRAVEALMRG